MTTTVPMSSGTPMTRTVFSINFASPGIGIIPRHAPWAPSARLCSTRCSHCCTTCDWKRLLPKILIVCSYGFHCVCHDRHGHRAGHRRGTAVRTLALLSSVSAGKGVQRAGRRHRRVLDKLTKDILDDLHNWLQYNKSLAAACQLLSRRWTLH